MRILKAKDYEGMSKIATSMLLGEITKGYNKKINIAITGGSTPIRMYELLRPILDNNPIPNVNYYNFDEIPLKGKEEGITMNSLRKLFYNPCHISEQQIQIFDEKNYQEYDKTIQENGGLDLVIMGLGKDGHFCGNLAGTLNDFDSGCRAVSNQLNETLHKRIIYLCGGEENVSEYYVTFGPKTVMRAKRIIMIVNGKEKAEIVKKIVQGKVDMNVPSSIFQLHPNFTLLGDEEALSLLD